MSVSSSFNEPLENIRYWQNLNPIKDQKIESPIDVVAIFLKIHDENVIKDVENLPSLEHVFKLIVDNKETLKGKPNLQSLESLRSIMFHISSIVKNQRSSNLINDLFLDSLSDIILPHLMLNTPTKWDKGKQDAIQGSLSVTVKLMPKANISQSTLEKVNRLRFSRIPD